MAGNKGGKIVVLGSGHMLSDKYLNCEKNDGFRDIIFSFLTTDKIMLNNIDAEDPEVRSIFCIQGFISWRIVSYFNFWLDSRLRNDSGYYHFSREYSRLFAGIDR